MKFIHTYTHGLIDYFVSALLLTGPWLFGFVGGRVESWAFIAMGALSLVYSLLTDYELGAIRVIPMPVHLGLDFLSGVFLLISPWLLGFSHRTFLPQVCFGLLDILVVVFSQTVPGPRFGHPDHIPLR